MAEAIDQAVIDMWSCGIYKENSTCVYSFAETVADRYVEEVGYSVNFNISGLIR